MTRLSAEPVTITPKQAQAWLDKRPVNRKINEDKVLTMAEAIDKGLWKLNGESIVINADGTVSDGQHRLMACTIANKPFKSIVVYGVNHDEVFESFDSTGGRSAPDRMSARGEKNVSLLAAAVSWL